MTQEELRQALRQPYARSHWTQLVQQVFGQHVRLESQAQVLEPGDESIKSISQIGDVTLDDGKNLALIEVEVSDNINLLRNRVSLRNRVARFIDQDKAHGVLAVFSSGKPEYRFTFTAKESYLDEEVGMVERETATKRFTYVLGPTESCTTAAHRFDRLSQKSARLEIEDVIEAFSVEKLNREFFHAYKEHYSRFCDYLLAPEQTKTTYRIFGIEKKTSAADQARAEKPVRDFVKRLLGRMVFLYFLQRKGWLGCPAEQSAWSGGDPAFLKTYFENSPEPQHFHSTRLVPLFYQALNTPGRKGDLFPLSQSRIPYLNGGLFEQTGCDETAIDFPADHFAGLLEFFSQYNFTIDENDPDEHEVGIDPEMLGHIFENLLEDNKDKGAYYTPKAIVHYMSQQSLIYYLTGHLGGGDDTRAAIEHLVRTKQRGEGGPHEKIIRTRAAEIEKLLDEVKICDPAIGSGAFPIGLLQEIFWLKLTLDLTLNEPSELARVKRAIIQNSIYGVDKDSGAVDIARLRFWLSLVVDEDQPRPLPNLDYKIMQGDSLLESFEGIRLDMINQPRSHEIKLMGAGEQDSFDFAEPQQILKVTERAAAISALIRDYFSATDPGQKQELHGKIDRFVLDHIAYNLELAQEQFQIELHQHQTEFADKKKRVKGWTPSKKEEKRVAFLEKSIEEISVKQQRLAELEQQSERPYFLWHLFFQDVFGRGGFDIVIANPPYVRQEAIKDCKPLLEREGYACFKGTADLFVYFYERSVHLLRDSGILTYITSNKYYRSGYGDKLRGFLAEKLTLQEMLDFGDAPVFNAIAYASILVGRKEVAPTGHALKAWNWKRGDKVSHVTTIMEEQAFPLEQRHLTADGWRLERPEVFALLEKLRSKGTPLGKYVEGRFYRGILTGLNDAFVVDRATRDRLIKEDPKSEEVLKPFLRGKDVKRWRANFAEQYLIKIESSENVEHPWSGLAPDQAEQVFKKTHPAVYQRFENYRKELIKRSDQGKYFWELRSCAYWDEFEKPKIVYPDIYEHQSFAFDSNKFYSANTAYFIPTPEKWITSLLNSNLVEWTYQCLSNEVRGGYLRAFSETMQHLPIPTATDKDQHRLTQLCEEAEAAYGGNQGSEIIDIEERINRIIYDLFDLSEDEIHLIESTLEKKSASVTISGEHGHTKKKDSLFRRLRELAKEHAYFSLDHVKQSIAGEDLITSDNTLREYMSEAMADGIIHDAGRGWYSSIPEPLKLDTAPVKKLVRILQKEFPNLPVSCSSTRQLNPYMHHLLGKFASLVYTESSALSLIEDLLRSKGYDVWNNPRGKEKDKFSIRENTVILRAGVSWNKFHPGPYAPFEILLVDWFQEVKSLNIMDLNEFHEMRNAALFSKHLSINNICKYLEERELKLDQFWIENNPLTRGFLNSPS